MLCVVVVVVLGPVIPSLWLRLLIMSLVYIAFGAAATFGFTRRLAKASKSDAAAPVAELGNAAAAVKAGLNH